MLRGLRLATHAAGKRLPEVRSVSSRSPSLRGLRAAVRGLEAPEDDAAEAEEEWRRFAAADEAEERRWLLRAPAGELEVGDDVRPIVGRDWLVGLDRALLKVGGIWTLAEAVAVHEAPGSAARIRRERRGGGVLLEDGGADSPADAWGLPRR